MSTRVVVAAVVVAVVVVVVVVAAAVVVVVMMAGEALKFSDFVIKPQRPEEQIYTD